MPAHRRHRSVCILLESLPPPVIREKALNKVRRRTKILTFVSRVITQPLRRAVRWSGPFSGLRFGNTLAPASRGNNSSLPQFGVGRRRLDITAISTSTVGEGTGHLPTGTAGKPTERQTIGFLEWPRIQLLEPSLIIPIGMMWMLLGVSL